MARHKYGVKCSGDSRISQAMPRYISLQTRTQPLCGWVGTMIALVTGAALAQEPKERMPLA